MMDRFKPRFPLAMTFRDFRAAQFTVVVEEIAREAIVAEGSLSTRTFMILAKDANDRLDRAMDEDQG